MATRSLTRRSALIAGAATAGSLAWPPGRGRAATPAETPAGAQPATAHAPAAAARWVRTSYDLVALSGLTPPSAARAYAAVSIAVYEALLGGMPRHRSAQGQLAGLTGLPPQASSSHVHWPLVVGAAASTVLQGLFPGRSELADEHLEQAHRSDLEDAERAGIAEGRRASSARHGAAVGRAVLRWVATDGHAEASALAYTPPTGPSTWVPTKPNFGRAIEPHCGRIRPMLLVATDEVAPAEPIPFSTEPGSAFRRQAEATYAQSFANTDEDRDLARFWTDNPTFSGLPAGHWMSITVQACEQRHLRLDATVEALLVAGVTLHDAFLNCWTWKYRHNLVRPVTYINRHVDEQWSSWVNTPQFPEHTSGHSVASRAAATTLTAVLGRFSFDDTSRATTAGIGVRTRRWADFTDAADSAAQSRLYGGIHFPHGIEAGKAQGDAVGALVLHRLRTRR